MNLRSSFPEELRILRADKRTRCRILYLIERTNRDILILLTRCCAIFLCYLGGGIYKGPINERSLLVRKLIQTVQLIKRTGLLICLLGVLVFLSLMFSNFLKIRNQVES